jgi:hypothetical protein
VVIEPRDVAGLLTDVPAGYTKTDAVLGGVAALAGWRAGGGTLEAAPGEPLALDLAWRAMAPTAARLKVTVQIVDAAGVPVAQNDAEPAEWTRPTTTWIPGEVILDRHEIPIPDDLPAGRYRVLVGMYDPATSERLPLASADQDTIELATLAVQALP